MIFDINDGISYYEYNAETIINKYSKVNSNKKIEIEESIIKFYDDLASNNFIFEDLNCELLEKSIRSQRTTNSINILITSILYFYCYKRENPSFRSSNISTIEILSEDKNFKKKYNGVYFNYDNESIERIKKTTLAILYKNYNSESKYICKDLFDNIIMYLFFKKKGLEINTEDINKFMNLWFTSLTKNPEELFTFISIRISCSVNYQYYLLIYYYDDIFIYKKTELEIKSDLIQKLKEMNDEYSKLREKYKKIRDIFGLIILYSAFIGFSFMV